MKIGTFGIKIWHGLSMIGVLLVVAYGYSSLPADVGVHFGEDGKADEFILKSQIFYVLLGLLLANNVLLPALGRQFLNSSAAQLPIPNRAMWVANQDELNEHIQNWVKCLVAAINTVIGLTFSVLATVNNQFKLQISDFGGLFVVVVAMLVIVVLALPVRLLMKPTNEA
jgi:uncharacterized membrane protein